ncbi:MAG: hypothetical protein ACI9EV_000348 [Urechidicola sp.]
MKTKFYTSILLLLLSLSCAKEETVTDQAAKVLVVNSFLEINKPIQSVSIASLDLLVGEYDEDLSDVNVKISHNQEEYILDRAEDGTYAYFDAEVLVQPNEEYELIVSHQGVELSAVTKTPLNYEEITVSKSILNSGLGFDQIDIGFNEGPSSNVFYIVNITNVETAYSPIIWTNQSTVAPRRNFIYNGSLDGVTLLSSYFEFYGKHEITIDRIGDDYFSLFKDKENSQFYTEQGNIDNGLGFFVGIDRYEFEITVQ